ncbi:hypothetical protein I6F30_22600 [Bradyrhizobium sp. NBAIM20]|uniref:TackOD1 domain-containing metal-binding protein n=1 Tax=Bradyrhizobium sp. NBAIM20 TaxID=2793811 RepID=UPI001CD406D9|nr:hypothetical protein [Bradyrhizobium sp. NBAIM20]MCA1463340.1 hypothetical protein [Bradyrhizobium sp. NBAIM18]
MQVESDQTKCPICNTKGLQHFPILHHMICAYVGPKYDFGLSDSAYSCPKCDRQIASNDAACEIVGLSARCLGCGSEMIVTPPGRQVSKERSE